MTRTLYAGDYTFRVNDTTEHIFTQVTTAALQYMKRLHPTGHTLLDVGTGYGTGVTVALDAGLDAIGIEPAHNLYNHAKNILGRRVLHTTVDQFVKRRPRTFDFITMIHVVEHVTDPYQLLRQAYTLLNTNGVLYIETPNSDSHLLRAEKDRYTFLTPPDHIHLFSPRSLSAAVRTVFHTRPQIKTYSRPEHFVGIIRALKRGVADRTMPNDTRPPIINHSNVHGRLPFFDRVIAPFCTPILNLGNQGSILQAFVQKLDPKLL